MQDRAKLLIGYNQQLDKKIERLQKDHDIRKKIDSNTIKEKVERMNNMNLEIEGMIKKNKE